MKTSYRYFFLIFFQLGIGFYAVAGCGYLLSDFSVTGSFTYDSINSTYYCHEGDTLNVIYNGTGGGSGYMEDYYFDGAFIGTRLDTIKIYKSGTLQVQQGCSSPDYIISRNFSFTLANWVNDLLENKYDLNVYYDSETQYINLILKSVTVSSFDITIYSVAGQKTTELKNLYEGVNYSLKNIANGLNIICISDKKGLILTKKIAVF